MAGAQVAGQPRLVVGYRLTHLIFGKTESIEQICGLKLGSGKIGTGESGVLDAGAL